MYHRHIDIQFTVKEPFAADSKRPTFKFGRSAIENDLPKKKKDEGVQNLTDVLGQKQRKSNRRQRLDPQIPLSQPMSIKSGSLFQRTRSTFNTNGPILLNEKNEVEEYFFHKENGFKIETGDLIDRDLELISVDKEINKFRFLNCGGRSLSEIFPGEKDLDLSGGTRLAIRHTNGPIINNPRLGIACNVDIINNWVTTTQTEKNTDKLRGPPSRDMSRHNFRNQYRVKPLMPSRGSIRVTSDAWTADVNQ